MVTFQIWLILELCRDRVKAFAGMKQKALLALGLCGNVQDVCRNDGYAENNKVPTHVRTFFPHSTNRCRSKQHNRQERLFRTKRPGIEKLYGCFPMSVGLLDQYINNWRAELEPFP
jgi:hypothetical protein